MQTADPAALFEACRRNDMDAVKAICEANPNLMHVQDAKGFTPVLIAVYNQAPDVVQYLLQQGAPADVPDASGNTALMGAAFKGYGDMVKALLAAGVEVDQRNGSGATALTFAATFGRMEAAEILLQHGASVSIADSRGKSPIDHALIQENEPMLRLLERYENGLATS